MSILNKEEICTISKQFGITNVIEWNLKEFSDEIIGYLGDHLKLIIKGEKDGVVTIIQLFVKCMPRFDEWKAEYLRELNFFRKEFIMLSQLFQDFHNGEGSEKWRPKLLFLREDLFVFEDVNQLGYKMPHHQNAMTLPALRATLKALARFHAQSYICEERKTVELARPYRIWDEYSEYLQEPEKGQSWRDTGRNAAIDFLKTFSKYKNKPDFSTRVEQVITILYDEALTLMKPSNKYRNTVIHRDLWTNNIFIKEDLNSGEFHSLLVDFQTVLYASPMLDVSSVIYFNTTRSCRDKHVKELISLYHDTLASILQSSGLDIANIFPKEIVMETYNESLIFGMTQASIIVPIVAMDSKKREEIFCDPERSVKANVVSRSEEFIEIAKEDPAYYCRMCELLDEIVEKYIYPDDFSDHVSVLNC